MNQEMDVYCTHKADPVTKLVLGVGYRLGHTTLNHQSGDDIILM